MKFRTQFEEDYQGSPGKIMDDSTQTVPDMGLSLQQLLINHSRGLPSPVNVLEGQYFEDLEIPQVEDLTDLKFARQELKRQEEVLRARVKDELKEPEAPIPLKEDLPREAPSSSDRG